MQRQEADVDDWQVDEAAFDQIDQLIAQRFGDKVQAPQTSAAQPQARPTPGARPQTGALSFTPSHLVNGGHARPPAPRPAQYHTPPPRIPSHPPHSSGFRTAAALDMRPVARPPAAQASAPPALPMGRVTQMAAAAMRANGAQGPPHEVTQLRQTLQQHEGASRMLKDKVASLERENHRLLQQLATANAAANTSGGLGQSSQGYAGSGSQSTVMALQKQIELLQKQIAFKAEEQAQAAMAHQEVGARLAAAEAETQRLREARDAVELQRKAAEEQLHVVRQQAAHASAAPRRQSDTANGSQSAGLQPGVSPARAPADEVRAFAAPLATLRAAVVAEDPPAALAVVRAKHPGLLEATTPRRPRAADDDVSLGSARTWTSFAAVTALEEKNQVVDGAVVVSARSHAGALLRSVEEGRAPLSEVMWHLCRCATNLGRAVLAAAPPGSAETPLPPSLKGAQEFVDAAVDAIAALLTCSSEAASAMGDAVCAGPSAASRRRRPRMLVDGEAIPRGGASVPNTQAASSAKDFIQLLCDMIVMPAGPVPSPSAHASQHSAHGAAQRLADSRVDAVGSALCAVAASVPGDERQPLEHVMTSGAAATVALRAPRTGLRLCTLLLGCAEVTERLASGLEPAMGDTSEAWAAQVPEALARAIRGAQSWDAEANIALGGFFAARHADAVSPSHAHVLGGVQEQALAMVSSWLLAPDGHTALLTAAIDHPNGMLDAVVTACAALSSCAYTQYVVDWPLLPVPTPAEAAAGMSGPELQAAACAVGLQGLKLLVHALLILWAVVSGPRTGELATELLGGGCANASRTLCAHLEQFAQSFSAKGEQRISSQTPELGRWIGLRTVVAPFSGALARSGLGAACRGVTMASRESSDGVAVCLPIEMEAWGGVLQRAFLSATGQAMHPGEACPGRLTAHDASALARWLRGCLADHLDE
ncbi:unnamed protein product [Pedinophyceae sp. YPF-701]|nr:unnamed protein product [Pedinophyceae sp. YPF-701]